MVLVRPDQYVSNILPLEAHKQLGDFLAGVLIDVATQPVEPQGRTRTATLAV
jgi:phenol 2-monooxygenase